LKQWYISNIQSSKEIFKVMEAIGLGVGEQQVSIHLRLANRLSRHLKVSNEVLVLAGSAGDFNDILIITGIVGPDIRI